MVKNPPFEVERTYFNRDAKPWIEANRTWNKAQIELTLDTLWWDANIRALYHAHKIGANADALAGFVPGQVQIPQHPYRVADKAAAKRTKLRPRERDANGALMAAPPVVPPPPPPAAPVAPAAPAAPTTPTTPHTPAPPAHPVVSPVTPPGAPSIPGFRVTSPTPAPSTGSTPPRTNTPGATAPAAQAPVVEPAVVPAVVPAIPDSLYHFDFWPAQPWDHDPDISEVPPSEDIRKNHDDQGLRQTAIDNFMNSKPLMVGVDESTWTAGSYLASGSYGAAGLWCRVDENNNIVQRMVVKDCPQTRFTYSTPKEWYDQLPREIALHRRIDRKRKRDETNDKGFTNIVEHFGYRLMMRRRRYRLYLKYYAGSDLGGLVNDRFNAWGRFTLEQLKRMLPRQLEDLPIIPEALLWYIIMNCASGYLILHHGKTNRTEPDPDWRPIMHLDLNISNAFIDPHPNGKSADIVVADLGMGFIERDAPPVPEGYEPLRSDNPYEWTWNARHTCHPPEHQFMWGSPPIKLSEKSDVWRLGSMIWEMMTNSRDSDHPMREDATFIDEGGDEFDAKQSVTLESDTRDLDADSMFPTPWRFYPSAERYSLELKQLVRDCLHWHLDSRKTFSELHDIARTEIFKHGDFDRDVNAELLPKYDDFAIGKRHKRRR